MITLAEDGSGLVQLTADYAEAITWSESADGIAIDGSNFLYGPVWDSDAQTLSLNYASDMIQITFEKESPEMVEPAETPQVAGSLPQVYICEYFTAAFPETWVQDEYNTS